MNKPSAQPPAAISKQTSDIKQIDLNKYRDKKDEDDWIEPDEATDSLSPKSRSLSTQVQHQPPINNDHLDLAHFIHMLKHSPDGSAYDSDEISTILKRFENPANKGN